MRTLRTPRPGRSRPGSRAALLAAVLAPWLVVGVAAPSPQDAPPPDFARDVYAFEVLDEAGEPYDHPLLGGFNLPRPQLVDIDADGDLDLFVQEYSDAVIFFENVGSAAEPRYEWRTDRFQDLAVGEWYFFHDVDADGDADLLAEQPFSLVRLYRNAGGPGEPRFEPWVETVKDTDGEPVFSDRQNIPKLADLDCDDDLDLLVGKVEGTVTRYEQAGVDDAGAPLFRHVADRFEGIEIIGQVLQGQGATPSRPGAPASRQAPASARRLGAIASPFVAPGSQGAVPAGRGPVAVSAPPGRPSRHGANTMALVDVDSDGDLDLFWGDFFEPGLLRIDNTGSCRNPNLRTEPRPFPPNDPVRTSGYNAPAFGDLDADGDPDLLVGVLGGAFNPASTGVDNLLFLEHLSSRRFELRTSRFVAMVDVGSESFPALVDDDGDGDLDLYLGNKIETDDPNSGALYRFENVGTAAAPRFRLRGALPLSGTYHYAPAFGDLDSDGDPDMLLGRWGDELALVINEGSDGEARWSNVDDAVVEITRGRNATPALGDLDGDGDLDLLVGESSGEINHYRNVGSAEAPEFELVTDEMEALVDGEAAIIDVGRRSSPALVDLDDDGDLDLVVGSEAEGVTLFRNRGTASEPAFARDDSLEVPLHPFSTPTFADLDGDGDADLLSGGIGGGLVYFENRRVGEGR